MREQTGEAAALVAARARFEVIGEQREIGVGFEQEQHAEPMAFVGGERVDRRGHGDRSDDGVARRRGGRARRARRRARRTRGAARRSPSASARSARARGRRARRDRRSAPPARMPIASAARLAETIASVFGSTTTSGTCIVLSRFCFSASARSALRALAVGAAAVDLEAGEQQRPARRRAARPPSPETTGARCGKRISSQVSSDTWNAATAPAPRTIACRSGGRSSAAGGDRSRAASDVTADRRSARRGGGQRARDDGPRTATIRSRTITAAPTTGDATVAANAGQSTSNAEIERENPAWRRGAGRDRQHHRRDEAAAAEIEIEPRVARRPGRRRARQIEPEEELLGRERRLPRPRGEQRDLAIDGMTVVGAVGPRARHERAVLGDGVDAHRPRRPRPRHRGQPPVARQTIDLDPRRAQSRRPRRRGTDSSWRRRRDRACPAPRRRVTTNSSPPDDTTRSRRSDDRRRWRRRQQRERRARRRPTGRRRTARRPAARELVGHAVGRRGDAAVERGPRRRCRDVPRRRRAAGAATPSRRARRSAATACAGRRDRRPRRRARRRIARATPSRSSAR